jgi:predicted dehydrogenase
MKHLNDDNSRSSAKQSLTRNPINRRSFLQVVGASAAAVGLHQTAQAKEKAEKPIQGFEKAVAKPDVHEGWKPVSDRKIRVGLAGYGVCQFSAAFGFQDHPNVEIVAVTDIVPDHCAALAKKVGCNKTYPSAEEMVKDDKIEAVFIATDAPSHARLCIEAMKHGKHAASAVPATFGSLEDADRLFETVKSTGMKYMMFETSCFHADLYAMRQIYNAGGFGKIMYAEGEYLHYLPKMVDSYKGWRDGLPPIWYPTHATAYYVGVTGGSFTEVSCQGVRSQFDYLQPQNNRYKNPFGTEVALFGTSDGGSARMIVSWDSPGYGGEMGRIRGQKGTYYNDHGNFLTAEKDQNQPQIKRTPLPPGVDPGSHGGSHGFLMNDFILSILENRKPLVGIAEALNMTVGGIVAHQSAMKGGKLLKIPQYKI